MDDNEREELVKKLQEDVDNFVSNLKPKKYEEGWPENRWEEEMEKHPIFMSKPVEEGQDLPPLVEALQQLKYDEEFNSPIELANSYKEDGNHNFKLKKYKWAIECYTKALDMKCEDNELNSILYNNRAAAQFHLGNFRKAKTDATEAKKLNPKNIKAVHRGALCCISLNQFEDCISWCIEGLKFEPENKSLIALKKQAKEQKALMDRKYRKRKVEELKKVTEIWEINSAISKRGIKFAGKGLKPEDLEPVRPDVSSKVHLEDGILVWPVMFFYPEHGISEVTQYFEEGERFYDHFQIIFSEVAPWDAKGEYLPENIQAYFPDKEDMVPFNKMDTLISVMRHERFRVKSGTLAFFLTVENSEFDKLFRKQYNLQ